MQPTKIDRDIFAVLKTALKTIWPNVRSGHADEAIAAYLGYRTYAGLLAAMPEAPAVLDVEHKPEQLVARLSELGYLARAVDAERFLRVVEAGLIERVRRNIRRMAAAAANDNR